MSLPDLKPDQNTAAAVERESLLSKLRERIVAYAASRMQRDRAEDLAQEVLLVLQQKYSQVEAIEELVPLSFQIARFKLRASERKAMRRGEHQQVAVEDVPLVSGGETPEQTAERRERREQLKAAIMRLDGRCRKLFRLKLEGRTFSEIQGILEAGSINTIYTWDSRCRKRLLKLMGGKWETER